MADIPEIPEAAITAAAEAIRRQWGPLIRDDFDFTPQAREVLAAAWPHLGESKRKTPRMAINVIEKRPEPTVRYVPVPVYRGPGGWRYA